MNKIPTFKLLITISIYCCVFANGICSNIYGPTWLDLKSLMNTTLEKMSLSISLRAAFFCFGALLGSFVYKYVDRGALYPLFILTKGLCVALIPLYANFSAFLAYSAIIGLVSGAADTSVNVWMLDIWQDKSAPFVQALQFFWAVGFIVSPLISNPFLSPESKAKQLAKLNEAPSSTTISPISERLVARTGDLNVSSTLSPFLNGTNINTTSTEDLVSIEEHMQLVQDSKLYIPYGVAGALCLIGSISLLIIYIERKCTNWMAARNAKNRTEYNKANQNDQESEKKIEDNKEKADEFASHESLNYSTTRCYLIQIILVTSVMTSAFCASEMTSFQYIATFCVKLKLGLSKSAASMVMTGVATSFAAGRFFGIFCAIKFKPLYILLADWAIILIGNLILLLSNSGVYYLWIGSILIGFGYASFFAAIFSYLRERIVVNNFISSSIILASLSGNALGFPIFIGKYIETMPIMMIYGNLFCLIIMLACFGGLALIDNKYGIKANIIKNLKKNQANEMIEKLKVEPLN